MDVMAHDSQARPHAIRLRKPADMHQHLRQGAMLKLVAPMVAKRFASAIVMPNTTPPVTDGAKMEAYRDQILKMTGPDFRPLMTLYLTDTLEPWVVRHALHPSRGCVAIKYYPRGLTTNSDSGVQDPAALWTKGTNPYEVLRELAAHDKVLLLHAADGFATNEWNNENRFYDAGEELDPYDQEVHFICNTLPRIRDAHPDLKISVEHLSTAIGADWLRETGDNKLGCSLTAHHLLLNRRDSLRGGLRPDRFWWPIIQSSEHQQELRKLATEDHPFVWLGSDSAPHPVGKKYASCCVGGVLMAHAGIELYAEAFEDMGALDDRFERFASVNGPAFFGFVPSEEKIELVREEWTVQQPFYADVVRVSDANLQDAQVVPFRLGEKIRWKLSQ